MFKSIFSVASGNALSQLILLGAFILFARLYSIEQFGAFSVLVGVSSIAGALACYRFELAILLPRCNRVAWLGMAVCLFLCVFSFVFLSLVSSILYFLSVFKLETIIYTLILGLGINLTEILFMSLNRMKKYSSIALAMIIRAVVFLGVGCVVTDYQDGLILASLCGYGASILVCMYYAHREVLIGMKCLSLRRLLYWIRRYSSFPLYSLPAALMNTVGMQLPTFGIRVLFGEAATGLYSMLQRVVFSPVGIVSGSINKVFSQRVASLIASRKSVLFDLKGVLIISAAIGGFVVCILLILTQFNFFSVFLGNDWKDIDVLVPYFLPFVFLSFCAKSVSRFAAYNRNKVGLFFQTIYLLLVSFIFLLVFLLDLEFILICQILSFGLSILMLIQLSLIFLVSIQHEERIRV